MRVLLLRHRKHLGDLVEYDSLGVGKFYLISGIPGNCYVESPAAMILIESRFRPRGWGTFFCTAKRKYPKKRPPGAGAPLTRSPLRFSPDWALANSLRSNRARLIPSPAAMLGAAYGDPGWRPKDSISIPLLVRVTTSWGPRRCRRAPESFWGEARGCLSEASSARAQNGEERRVARRAKPSGRPFL